jgi:hypothetical protein
MTESPSRLREVVASWPAHWSPWQAAGSAALSVLLLGLSLVKALAGTYSPFIYYRF